MNKIILLILFNFLIYYLCKTNIYLAISIFLFMIYYIIRLRYNITNNIIEGQSYETYEEIDYKNNFINSLNDDIIKNRESKFYLDIVFDKLNMFLKKYISKENIPVDQPCIGIFDSWSDCSVDCGTGSQYRKYSILQNSGEGGIKCIFKDGQIDKKTCYKGLCNYNASCVEDNDCNTGYCNPFTKLCDYREKCTIYALYNCEPDECDKLGENYHIDSNGNCIDYSQREYNPDFSPGSTPPPSGSTPGLTPPTPPSPPPPTPPSPPPPTPPSPPPPGTLKCAHKTGNIDYRILSFSNNTGKQLLLTWFVGGDPLPKSFKTALQNNSDTLMTPFNGTPGVPGIYTVAILNKGITNIRIIIDGEDTCSYISNNTSNIKNCFGSIKFQVNDNIVYNPDNPVCGTEKNPASRVSKGCDIASNMKIEMTLQSDKDYYDVSMIPDKGSSGAHMNKYAVNYGTPNSLDRSDATNINDNNTNAYNLKDQFGDEWKHIPDNNWVPNACANDKVDCNDINKVKICGLPYKDETIITPSLKNPDGILYCDIYDGINESDCKLTGKCKESEFCSKIDVNKKICPVAPNECGGGNRWCFINDKKQPACSATKPSPTYTQCYIDEPKDCKTWNIEGVIKPIMNKIWNCVTNDYKTFGDLTDNSFSLSVTGCQTSSVKLPGKKDTLLKNYINDNPSLLNLKYTCNEGKKCNNGETPTGVKNESDFNTYIYAYNEELYEGPLLQCDSNSVQKSKVTGYYNLDYLVSLIKKNKSTYEYKSKPIPCKPGNEKYIVYNIDIKTY